MHGTKNYALYRTYEKMKILNVETSDRGAEHINALLSNDYNIGYKADNFIIRIVKSLCLPNSIFTIDRNSSIKLTEIYFSLLSDSNISDIKQNTFLNLELLISENESIDFSTQLSYVLIKQSLFSMLNVKLSENIEKFFFDNKNIYKNNLENSKKVLFLAALPIPFKLKLFFLKKKKHMHTVANTMFDLIYQENKVLLDEFSIKNNINKKELTALLNTIIVNMLTLTFSICTLIILMLKHKQYQKDFIEDKIFAKKCYLENLRLFPPVTLLETSFKKKSKCPFHRSKTILFDLYKSQRKSSIENANAFDPNRKIENHLFFGVGPTRCIGKHFSISVSAYITQQLFMKYKINCDTFPKIKFFGKILSLDSDLMLNLARLDPQ